MQNPDYGDDFFTIFIKKEDKDWLVIHR